MELRRAAISDVELIAPLFDRYRRFYELSADLESARGFIRERLEKNESIIFLAIDSSGEPAGFAQMYPLFSSLALRRSLIVNDLFVSPMFRRKGVARALLKACGSYGREIKARSLSLQTAMENLAAQRLYESMGWRLDRRFLSYNLIIEMPCDAFFRG